MTAVETNKPGAMKSFEKTQAGPLRRELTDDQVVTVTDGPDQTRWSRGGGEEGRHTSAGQGWWGTTRLIRENGASNKRAPKKDDQERRETKLNSNSSIWSGGGESWVGMRMGSATKKKGGRGRKARACWCGPRRSSSLGWWWACQAVSLVGKAGDDDVDAVDGSVGGNWQDGVNDWMDGWLAGRIDGKEWISHVERGRGGFECTLRAQAELAVLEAWRAWMIVCECAWVCEWWFECTNGDPSAGVNQTVKSVNLSNISNTAKAIGGLD